MTEKKNMLLQAAQSDRQAFSQLYREFSAPVFRFLLWYGEDRSLAEDITQEVFLDLLRAPQSVLEQVKNTKQYLLSMARHRFLNHRKREQSQSKVYEKFVVQNMSQQSEEDDNIGHRLEKVSDALRKLPREQREVLVLRLFEDMDFMEIGSLVETPPKTAESRYYLGLKKIQEIMGIKE